MFIFQDITRFSQQNGYNGYLAKLWLSRKILQDDDYLTRSYKINDYLARFLQARFGEALTLIGCYSRIIFHFKRTI